MFSNRKVTKGECAKKPAPPIEIKEVERSEEEWKLYNAPEGFVRRKRNRDKLGAGQIDDESVLVELTWAARDVTAKKCPRSRKELRHRLGLGKLKQGTKQVETKLAIEGIGEMELSDESAGVILTTSSGSPSESNTDTNDVDRRKPGRIPERSKRKRTDLNVPNPRRNEPVAMLHSPYSIANGLLHHLVLSTLANHNFRDTVHLMSLCLIESYRSLLNQTPIQFLRLLIRFYKMIPELCYSDMHVELLQKCYKTPDVMRDDIVMSITCIQIIRGDLDAALDYLQQLVKSAQRVTVGSLRCMGTVRLCTALVFVARWLMMKEPDSRKRRRREIERFGTQLGQRRELAEARTELEAGVAALWKSKITPPIMFIRLIVLMNLDKDMDMVLSILEDFLTITPYSPDLLELKLLLLQRRSREWDTADFLSSLVHGSDDLDLLIRTTLKYIDSARGEPQSLTLAVQAFDVIPLVDRLRVLFLFLRSNRAFGPALRLLVAETLTFLGRSQQRILSDQTRASECGFLWQIVDQVLGPLDKLNWYRGLFDASRTSLSQLRPSDRIFVFLLAPFFVSSWDSLADLGRIVSESFPTRHSLFPLRTHPYNQRSLPSTVTFPSLVTHQTIDGFLSLIDFVYSLPQSTLCPVDTTELVLLTEVGIRLSPLLTIQNTTRDAETRWRELHPRQHQR